MDDKSIELFVASHSIFARELSPEYASYKEQLLSALALSNTDIKSLRGEREVGVDNAAAIREFMGHLPVRGTRLDRYGKTEACFAGTEFDTVLMQQAAGIFYDPADNNQRYTTLRNELPAQPERELSGHQAYYVVGMNVATSEVLAFRMQHDVEADPNGLLVRFKPYIRFVYDGSDVSNKRWGASAEARKVVERQFSAIGVDLAAYGALTLTPHEAIAKSKSLFDEQSGTYVIKSSDSESKKLNSIEKIDRGAISNKVYVGFDELEQGFVSDQDLLDFHVTDHLSRLATMFDKDAELKEAFQIQKPSVEQ